MPFSTSSGPAPGYAPPQLALLEGKLTPAPAPAEGTLLATSNALARQGSDGARASGTILAAGASLLPSSSPMGAPALAPGGCPEPSRLEGLPCWLFPGVNDVVLPVRVSDRIHAALRAQNGGKDPELLRYSRIEDCPYPPGYPHSTGYGSPIPAFATEGLWEWLLAKRARAAPSVRDTEK